MDPGLALPELNSPGSCPFFSLSVWACLRRVTGFYPFIHRLRIAVGLVNRAAEKSSGQADARAGDSHSTSKPGHFVSSQHTRLAMRRAEHPARFRKGFAIAPRPLQRLRPAATATGLILKVASSNCLGRTRLKNACGCPTTVRGRYSSVAGLANPAQSENVACLSPRPYRDRQTPSGTIRKAP